MRAALDAYGYLDQLKLQDGSHEPSFENLLDYLDARAREKGIPLRGQFELTPLCNFDCKMCYTHLTPKQMGDRKTLSVEQWKNLMRQAWDAGMLCVNLTGGECLAYPGLKEICLYLRGLGCEVTILTNGYLLDEQWVQFFQENKPRMIQITLYGSDDDHYEQVTGQRSFDTVAENIRRALAAGIPVVLTVTPNSYQQEDLFETLRAAKSFGCPVYLNAFLDDPREETGRSGKKHDMDFEAYARMYSFWNELWGQTVTPIAPEKLPVPGGPHHEGQGCGLTCKAGLSSFNINWDGKMVACNSIPDICADPLKDGFQKAWDQIHQRALAWPAIPECVDCPYASACSNCAALKQRFAEPGKQPLQLCEQTRYLVQRGIKRIPLC